MDKAESIDDPATREPVLSVIKLLRAAVEQYSRRLETLVQGADKAIAIYKGHRSL